MTTCEITGCDRSKIKARGLCSRHYAEDRALWMPECEVEDCTAKAYARGLCARCYGQEWYWRDREPAPKPEPKRINLGRYPKMPPLTETTYENAHDRVRQYRGRASEHLCPCGKQAEHWAYNNNGGQWEQTGYVKHRGRGEGKTRYLAWSRHILDYDALCARCHRVRDAQADSPLSIGA